MEETCKPVNCCDELYAAHGTVAYLRVIACGKSPVVVSDGPQDDDALTRRSAVTDSHGACPSIGPRPCPQLQSASVTSGVRSLGEISGEFTILAASMRLLGALGGGTLLGLGWNPILFRLAGIKGFPEDDPTTDIRPASATSSLFLSNSESDRADGGVESTPWLSVLAALTV